MDVNDKVQLLISPFSRGLLVKHGSLKRAIWDVWLIRPYAVDSPRTILQRILGNFSLEWNCVILIIWALQGSRCWNAFFIMLLGNDLQQWCRKKTEVTGSISKIYLFLLPELSAHTATLLIQLISFACPGVALWYMNTSFSSITFPLSLDSLLIFVYIVSTVIVVIMLYNWYALLFFIIIAIDSFLTYFPWTKSRFLNNCDGMDRS